MISDEKPIDFQPKFEVVGCFIEYHNNILLLKRSPFKPQPNTYGTPGGKVKLKETIIEAMIRETEEETSLKLSPNQLQFYKTKYVIYPEYQYLYHMFFYQCTNEPIIKINPTEHQDYIWINPQNALLLNLIQDEDYCIIDYYHLNLLNPII